MTNECTVFNVEWLWDHYVNTPPVQLVTKCRLEDKHGGDHVFVS